MLKKIDQLLISSFFPPFLASFLISMFVLLMSTLWAYIDDIAGKGLNAGLIMELMLYLSVSMIPLALPLGALLASVMVMGKLAEQYELSSIKSAGISMWRTMLPLLMLGLMIGLFSIYCSDTLIPVSKLKFGSRMYDIQQKEPTIQMEAGVFNYDFAGFAIYFKEKAKNGRNIKDVLIYDHSSKDQRDTKQVIAQEGEMKIIPKAKLFVLRLKNGYQYADQGPAPDSNQANYPFIRMNFKEWEKKFDLSQFALERTNPVLFEKSRQSMNSQQLWKTADSISVEINAQKNALSSFLNKYFSTSILDSSIINGQQSAHSSTMQEGPYHQIQMATTTQGIHFSKEQKKIYQKAKESIQQIASEAAQKNRKLEDLELTRVKHQYDLHMKYVMGIVCVLFVLIGSSMGAIIRKGGFGYPILISIIIFVLFIIMNVFFRKMGENFLITAFAAAYLPASVLLILGLMLTQKAR